MCERVSGVKESAGAVCPPYDLNMPALTDPDRGR